MAGHHRRGAPDLPGLLTYAAHNVEEAEAVPFWDALDAIGVTLYPVLGADQDLQGAANRDARCTADGSTRSPKVTGKPVIVAEIGLRSARGAALASPGKAPRSARRSPIRAPGRGARRLARGLDRPAIEGVLIWRWFTDPAAGGPADTDFTVQGKPAERGCSARAR